MGGAGGVVVGKWRQVYLHNNKKDSLKKIRIYFAYVPLSKVVEPIYTPTNNVGEYSSHQVLHLTAEKQRPRMKTEKS